MRRKALAQLPGDLNQPTNLRSISLVADCKRRSPLARRTSDRLPDDIRYLAGLQRVEYVFVDPQHHDIVLAGPAEGWKVNEQGEVVGAKNGRAVLRLDDLLVALRSADQARNGGISCSIDPTPRRDEAAASLLRPVSERLAIPSRPSTKSKQRSARRRSASSGVPGSSHFALVMVAADHRMKRLAMNFEPSPVKGMPSYLAMLSPAKTIQTPRWWLAANYEPLLKDEDGLAWQLRGTGVKCLTEEDHFTQTGSREHTGKANPLAQKWADKMTEKFDELSAKDTIFGSLAQLHGSGRRRQPDHARASGQQGRLPARSADDAKQLPIEEYQVPKQVDSRASVLKKGHNYIISASGGVLFQPWAVIRDSKIDSNAAAVRGKVVETAKATAGGGIESRLIASLLRRSQHLLRKFHEADCAAKLARRIAAKGSIDVA